MLLLYAKDKHGNTALYLATATGRIGNYAKNHNPVYAFLIKFYCGFLFYALFYFLCFRMCMYPIKT